MGWHPHDPLPVDCHFLVRTVAPDSSSFSTQPALDGIPSLTCLHRNPCPVQATAQPSLSPNPVQQSATSALLPLPMMALWGVLAFLLEYKQHEALVLPSCGFDGVHEPSETRRLGFDIPRPDPNHRLIEAHHAVHRAQLAEDDLGPATSQGMHHVL